MREAEGRTFVGIAGLCLILVMLWDAFETVVLPRRVTRKFRLTRIFYRSTWKSWLALSRYLAIVLPPWMMEFRRTDHWQTSAWKKTAGFKIPKTKAPGKDEHF